MEKSLDFREGAIVTNPNDPVNKRERFRIEYSIAEIVRPICEKLISEFARILGQESDSAKNLVMFAAEIVFSQRVGTLSAKCNKFLS